MREITPQYILDISSRIKAGEKIEEDKLELKREWKPLGNGQTANIEEICKNILAIANTPGLVGHIIFGIDENTGDIFDAKFNQTGLNDVSKLRGILVKRTDPPPNFDVKSVEVVDGERKVVSFIEIPPSLDKPHGIKNFKGGGWFIPIRKGTGTYAASPSDLEFMFYDRKNIEPEYRLEIERYQLGVSFKGKQGARDLVSIRSRLNLVLQNKGRRPIVIMGASLLINHELEWQSIREFEGVSWSMWDKQISNTFGRPFSINSNESEIVDIEFEFEEEKDAETGNTIVRDFQKLNDYSFVVRILDIEGKEYSQEFMYF